MKRLFVVILIALVLSSGIAALIAYDPGYMLLSYGQYTLETSIWIGLLVVVLMAMAVYFVLWFSSLSLRWSFCARKWIGRRDRQKKQRQTFDGLLAFTEGSWKKSRQLLEKSAELSPVPVINYLYAAKASQKLDDSERQAELLLKAQSVSEENSLVVELTNAELQFNNRQYEACLATLKRIKSNHPVALKLLMQVYIALNDWDGLAVIFPALYKNNIEEKSVLLELEKRCACSQLACAAELEDQPFARLQSVWDSLTKTLRTDPQVMESYIQALRVLNKDAVAETVLRAHLKKNWSAELIRLYGLIKGEELDRQLLQAESWLKQRTNDSALLLCLGRLSMRNELWGKAKDYFIASLKLERNGEACAELGRLLAHLGEHEQSNQYFQMGLMNNYGLPELPLPHKSQ